METIFHNIYVSLLDNEQVFGYWALLEQPFLVGILAFLKLMNELINCALRQVRDEAQGLDFFRYIMEILLG